MKSSKEIAETVFRIRDEYLEKKRIRSIKIRKIASCCSAACLCAIVLVCAKNMQMPSVDDWINPSSDTSGFETTQDSTTIKIVTSEDISEFPTTDIGNNQTPPISTPTTDIPEENTEHSDNQSTATTAKSDGNGNNIKTTKHSGSQNVVTTRKPATGSVNNTKTTKHTTKPNAFTTRKSTTGGGSSVNTGVIIPPVTVMETNNPKTTKYTNSPILVTTYTTTNISQTAISPHTTVRVVSTGIHTNIVLETTVIFVTEPPQLGDATTLVKMFSEIYYNDIVYQANSTSGNYQEIDYDAIDSYIRDSYQKGLDSSGMHFYSIKCELYKIKNVPVDEAIAVKFEGYDTYFIYKGNI